MNAEAIKKLTDKELGEVITTAQTELKERADQRRHDAIEQIRQIAATVGVPVSFGRSAKKAANDNKRPFKAGERFQNPDDPTKVWTVGSGRPPHWIDRAKKLA